MMNAGGDLSTGEDEGGEGDRSGGAVGKRFEFGFK